MERQDLADLSAFLVVAREASFTRAAAQLGTSQSALSHTLQRLEERLGIRLLNRTTRRVAPTEAGQRLLDTLGPALRDIEGAVTEARSLGERPSGTIRLTCSDHAAHTVVWPALEQLLPRYPEIRVELSLDEGFADVVAGRFDAGVRLGEAIARDMVAVPVGPPLRMAVVGAPAYLATHPPPRAPEDLEAHDCINQRFPTSGTLYAWEFERDGREVQVRVSGALVFNRSGMMVRAALAGFGLACVMEDRVAHHVERGELVRVLEEWCPAFPGYLLYYPNRRRHSAAFALLVDALRYRE